MKQYSDSKAECVPDEVERKLRQITRMHENGYRSIIGIEKMNSIRPQSPFCHHNLLSIRVC